MKQKFHFLCPLLKQRPGSTWCILLFLSTTDTTYRAPLYKDTLCSEIKLTAAQKIKQHRIRHCKLNSKIASFSSGCLHKLCFPETIGSRLPVQPGQTTAAQQFCRLLSTWKGRLGSALQSRESRPGVWVHYGIQLPWSTAALCAGKRINTLSYPTHDSQMAPPMLPDGFVIVLCAFQTAIMSATSHQSYITRRVPLQNRNMEDCLCCLEHNTAPKS